MVKVIGIDIGHGANTFPPSKGVYKNGVGYEEHDFNSKVGLRLGELLEAHGYKIVFGQKPYGPDVPLGERKDIYVSNKVDLVVSVHANYNNNSAVNGRCVFYWNTNQNTKRLAETIVEQMKALGYSTHGNGLHASKRGDWTNLYILRELPMASILIEHGFMGGSQDFDLVFGNKQAKYVEDMAQADAKGILKYLGKTFKAPKPAVKPATKPATKTPAKPKAVTGTVYRVQVGAFKDVASVAKYADEVERKTKFNTYVADTGEWLKVQVGAFSDKANADKRVASLKKAGYKDAFVTSDSVKAVPALEPYNEPVDKAPKKPWKEVAQEVYEGTGGWGNNPDRKNKIEAQGYSYKQIQAEVNRLAKAKAPINKARVKGDRVTVSSQAKKYTTGQSIPNFVKGNTYTVLQVNTHSVLLKEIMSWVNKSDLIN